MEKGYKERGKGIQKRQKQYFSGGLLEGKNILGRFRSQKKNSFLHASHNSQEIQLPATRNVSQDETDSMSRNYGNSNKGLHFSTTWGSQRDSNLTKSLTS